MILHPEQRTKLDATDDREFYSFPRIVTHVDENFIEQLTTLYRQRLQPNTRILDLMSSWVSHLPEELEFAQVEGQGMNEEELQKNSRLHHYFVQDLNKNLQLPFDDKSFDAVLIAVSVQYLQYPEAIFGEIYRILNLGGMVIVSFSNRMFYQKAIAAWREGNDLIRVNLAKSYFQAISGFSQPEILVKTPNIPIFLQMLGIDTKDPFYAVISHRIE